MKLIIILFSLILIAYADNKAKNNQVILEITFKNTIASEIELYGDSTYKNYETCIKEKLNFEVNGGKSNTKIAVDTIIELVYYFCRSSNDQSRESSGLEFDRLVDRFSKEDYSTLDVNCAKKRLQQLAPNDDLIKDFIAIDNNAECDEFIKSERTKLNVEIFQPETFEWLNIEECMEPISAANTIEIWRMIVAAFTEPTNVIELLNLRQKYANINNNLEDTLLSCALKNFN